MIQVSALPWQAVCWFQHKQRVEMAGKLKLDDVDRQILRDLRDD